MAAARSGALTATLRGRRLHSQHDPEREASRAADALQPERPDQLVVLFGAGLGYLAQHLLAKMRNRLVLVEPIEELATHVLNSETLAPALRDGRLRVFSGRPREQHWEQLLAGVSNQDVVFYLHQAAFAAHPVYAEVRTQCEDFLNRKSVNMATLSRFDRQWARNILANLPHLLRARPVARLFATARGTAAVCGAGPSLAQSLAELRSIRERVLLIAVDTAVRPLLQAGIDPDLIVTVDPQPVNRHFLECYRGAASFVVDPTTSYLTLRLLPPDRTFFSSSPFPLARLLLAALTEPAGEISFGGSVSTNAYDLAVRMGCNRVLLYGQDMSFSGGLAHVRGAVLEERWNFLEARLRRRELHNHRQLSALPVRWLPGLAGEPVPTNDKLLIFHGWFRRRLMADLELGLTIHNRTATGAALPTSNEPWEPEHLAIERAPPETSATRVNRAAVSAAIEAALADLRQLVTLTDHGLLDAEQFQKAVARHGAPSDQLLARLDSWDEQLRAQIAGLELVGSIMQSVIFRHTAKFGHNAESGAGPQARGGWPALAQSTTELYRALAQSAELLATQLRRAGALMDAESAE